MSIKSNKQMAEAAIRGAYLLTSTIEWSDGKHPVATFYLAGKKMTYSIDCTPKAEYTTTKTAAMLKKALRNKAQQWGYIKDPAEFETAFMKR